MMETILEHFAALLEQSSVFAPFLAAAAGVLASFRPCSLVSVPVVIGIVNGGKCQSTSQSFWLSVTFALGNAITFTALGVIVSSAGIMMNLSGRWWYIFLSILMFAMALQTWGVINIIDNVCKVPKYKFTGYFGALAAGVLSGLAASPCATPVLLVLLGMLASNTDLANATFLMLCYSLGHGALTVITGTSLTFARELCEKSQNRFFEQIRKIVLGLIMVALGVYMLTLMF